MLTLCLKQDDGDDEPTGSTTPETVAHSGEYDADVSASIETTQVSPEPKVKQERGLKRKAEDDSSASSRRLRSHASQEVAASQSVSKTRRQKKQLRRAQSQSLLHETPKPGKNRRLKSTRSLITPSRQLLEDDEDCIYVLPTPPDKREARTSSASSAAGESSTPTRGNIGTDKETTKSAAMLEVVIPTPPATAAAAGKS